MSQLSEDVYQYDAHVECIQLLRQLGDLDRVRRAREEMSRVFPLSEGVWVCHVFNLMSYTKLQSTGCHGCKMKCHWLV